MSTAAEEARPRSLWLNRAFTTLWTAHALSQFGTQIVFFALPILAVTTLGASKTQLGMLAAAESLPFLLLSLPAGVWVDRWSHRRILVVADLLRAGLLAAIPLAHLAGLLTFPLLLVVALLVGAVTVFFDIAYLAYLPALVDRRDLATGNARLEFCRSVAETTGPGLGGLAVQWTSAVTAVWGNVATFLGSALLLGFPGRHPAQPPPHDTNTTMAESIREGMRFVFGHPTLRALTLATATANLFGIGGALSAVLTAYAVHDLHLSVGLFGLALTVGNVGSIGGALLHGPLMRSLGPGRLLILTSLLPALGLMLLASTTTKNAVMTITSAIGLMTASITIYNVTQLSLRQAVTPTRLQGRMNASVRFAIWGTLPLGAFAGGFTADLIGIRPTLWCAGVLTCAACLPLLTHPVRALREIPEAPDVRLTDAQR